MERWSERIHAVAQRALVRGALEPIATDAIERCEHGFPFVLRWVSTLARKPPPASTQESKRHNPFLPPEPELTVGALGARHLVVLNKYPVFSGHTLIVTRDFEPQTAPLSGDDFLAWYALLAEGGLGFYNGGEIAGASQSHRHLQWIPDGHLGKEQLHAFLPPGETGWAELPWAAWREPLPLYAEGADWGAAAHRAYCTALAAMGWRPDASQLPPYDLLLQLDRLFFIPRRVERLAGVSVNALGYAGSLFASSPEKLRALAALDLVEGLCTLGWPRAELASGKR
ncbi:phosphorylase [Tepidiphilus olei]|uniref:phosphorylase n=1 Tax=Tepidiphilus olei TaxID=2502184 RepID=UPI00115D3C11|nr:phosphorylase [Tepidiphilus olei]